MTEAARAEACGDARGIRRRRRCLLPSALAVILLATEGGVALVVPSLAKASRRGSLASRPDSTSFLMAASSAPAVRRKTLPRALPTYSTTSRRSKSVDSAVPPPASVEAILRLHGVSPPRNEMNAYTDSRGSFVELSAAQEADCLQRMQNAAALLEIRQELEETSGQAPSLFVWAAAAGTTAAELTEELEAAAAAKRLLVASNIPLVLSVVQRQYEWRLRVQELQMSKRDLVQEGTCGLIRAAEMFTPARGVRFRTYAWRAIKNHIDQAIYNSGRLVRVPKIAAQRAQKNDASPVADAARRALAATRRIDSLDRQLEGGNTLCDVLRMPAGTDSLDADDGFAINVDLRQALEAALTPREQRLLTLRFGLQGGKPYTMQQCAEALFLSREHAGRLFEASLAKVRDYIERGDEMPAAVRGEGVAVGVA